ncbi:DUF29 domain-containing protein [Tautonia plasticadhaerens]|uniref:DUF29 domain-containing protein n=1 Tax=Tautonia plasticadhaerens TaxID=2527974 RepID=A0A518H8V2_9BACT|nr:DUF29 domain-containing protein [Tautonia plasticadhaerens]QDV37251.1 hypothetical protein ElP_51860 [Tautonia plasticadhaerens]
MRIRTDQYQPGPPPRPIEDLASLYRDDETAWLEIMSSLARQGRVEEFDLPSLSEYLADMAWRDRREVESRLVVLMSHLLKWEHQPDQRSRSWKATIVEQRQELNRHAGRGVLKNHGIAVVETIYPEAIDRAAAETGLSRESFPPSCPFTFDGLLMVEVDD